MNITQTSTMTINGLNITQAVWQPPQVKHAPILMLHGWGANSGLMKPLAERLAPLGYPVYALDLPGFGHSEPPPTTWSVFDYANFIIAYMDTLSLDRVFLFGHSFGGRLGLYLGAEHAPRLIKMALANSAGVLPKRSNSGQFRLKLYKRIRDRLYRIGAKSLADSLRTWYNNRYGSADFRAANGVMRQVLVQSVNEDLLPYAERVAVPTLLFWGDQDQDTPLWQAQTLERAIPDAGLITYQGAGHYSYIDRAADVARVIDHFFSQ